MLPSESPQSKAIRSPRVAPPPRIVQGISWGKGRALGSSSPSDFIFSMTRKGCWRGPVRRRIRSCPKRNGRPWRRMGRIRSFHASVDCCIANCVERRSLCPPSRPALADWRSQWLPKPKATAPFFTFCRPERSPQVRRWRDRVVCPCFSGRRSLRCHQWSTTAVQSGRSRHG